jgi:hypothetical protein
MSGSFHLKDFSQRISLDAATTWLSRNGWAVTSDDCGGLLCQGPPDDAGNPITCRLPCEEGYADYELRLEDLIATLSKVEERPAIEIVTEMAALDATEEKPISVPPTLEELVGVIERSTGGELSTAQRQQIVDDLIPILANLEIAARQAPDVDELAMVGAVAQTIVYLAKRLPMSTDAKLKLWEICSCLLGNRMAMTLAELDEFYLIAFGDDPSHPDDLLVWLRQRLTRDDDDTSRMSSRNDTEP